MGGMKKRVAHGASMCADMNSCRTSAFRGGGKGWCSTQKKQWGCRSGCNLMLGSHYPGLSSSSHSNTAFPLGWFNSTSVVSGNLNSVLFLSPPNDCLSFKIKSPVYSPQPEWILLSATENPPDVQGEPGTPDSESMASPPHGRASLWQGVYLDSIPHFLLEPGAHREGRKVPFLSDSTHSRSSCRTKVLFFIEFFFDKQHFGQNWCSVNVWLMNEWMLKYMLKLCPGGSIIQACALLFRVSTRHT